MVITLSGTRWAFVEFDRVSLVITLSGTCWAFVEFDRVSLAKGKSRALQGSTGASSKDLAHRVQISPISDMVLHWLILFITLTIGKAAMTNGKFLGHNQVYNSAELDTKPIIMVKLKA
ncbi:hypothetical protein VNO77_07722 [Canavalia gladiata]|uniref:Uncharacterized protein n=1 Tax=Canavalia gladiata TaxID=3824 RepID=A0AAN9QVY3_CANGL